MHYFNVFSFNICFIFLSSSKTGWGSLLGSHLSSHSICRPDVILPSYQGLTFTNKQTPYLCQHKGWDSPGTSTKEWVSSSQCYPASSLRQEGTARRVSLSVSFSVSISHTLSLSSSLSLSPSWSGFWLGTLEKLRNPFVLLCYGIRSWYS